MDVFISYSRKDSAIVQEFAKHITAAGFSVWMDIDGIESGDEFKDKIVSAIEESRVFLFFSSEASNVSPWTVKEVNVAVALKKSIIPIRLDESAYNKSILFDLAGLDFISYDGTVGIPSLGNKLLRSLSKRIKKNIELESGYYKKEYAKTSNETINGHEYVDLGLPSGLKWATCNVGASSPNEYGNYYAWGETGEKGLCDWDTYKWCKGGDDTMTKYCTNSNDGIVDNKTVLDLEDDVAHVKWGGSWRMPTLDEQKELLDNCTWIWTTENGINGYRVTGPNGNSIFLPAAGYLCGAEINRQGGIGCYWSSSLDNDDSYIACFLYFDSAIDYWESLGRLQGRSVRPVSE